MFGHRANLLILIMSKLDIACPRGLRQIANRMR
jgi:hypothetical protein